MKKNTKIITLIFLSLFCCNIIKAKAEIKEIKIIHTNDSSREYFGRTDSHDSLGSFDITIDGQKYLGFCVDPQGANPCGANWDKEVNCKRTIEKIDISSNNLNRNYNAGVLKIFNILNSKADKSGIISYEDRSLAHMALRIYKAFWSADTNICRNPNGWVFTQNAYYFLADELRKDNDINQAALLLGDKIKKVITQCIKNGNDRERYIYKEINYQNIKWDNHDDAQIKAELYGPIKTYILEALYAAANPDQTLNSSVNISEPKIIINDKKVVTIELEVNANIVENQKISLGLNCPKCISTYNIKYLINGKEISINDLQNIEKHLKEGKGIIQFVLTPKDNIKICERIDFSIDGTYPSVDVYLIGDGNGQEQHPIYIEQKVITGENGESNYKKTGNFNTCNLDCEEAQKKCQTDGIGSVACDYFKKEYNETCYKCEIVGSPVVCDPNNRKIQIEEGYGYEVKNGNTVGNKEKNIFQCIIGKNDENKNSYQDTKLGNEYCAVYCKEDYEFNVPGIPGTNTGRQFKINVGIKGTKTCYTSEINLEQYRKDAKNDKATADEKLNKCISWEMNYELNPNLEVKYYDNNGELYKSAKKELKEETDKRTVTSTEDKCSSVNSKTYENCVNATNLTTTKFVKKSITINANYSTENLFCQKYTSGVVTIGNCNYKNGKLLEGLAVPFSTETGEYDYKIIFKNIGEYYENNEYGRIWGGNGKNQGLIEKAISEKKIEAPAVDKNGTEYACRYQVNIEGCANYDCGNGTSPDTVCKSLNGGQDKTLKELRELYPGDKNCPKCPDCPIESVNNCVGKTSVKCCVNPDGNKYMYGKKVSEQEFNKKCNNENCPNCPLFYSNKRNFTFKPVSTGNVNPSNRTMGRNWRYDETIDTAIELKADVTTTQIEKSEEYIYDTENNKVNTDNRNVSVTVKLDTNVISKIKKYNKNAEKNGGYYNDSLTCYDYKGEDGNTYSNLFCYSDFIDHIFSGENSSKLKVNGGTRPVNDIDRGNPGTYWSTWSPKYVQDAMKQNGIALTTERILDFTQQYQEIGVGPSWK